MLWMLWICSHKQPDIFSKEEKDKVVKIWWKSEQFLMVTQGKARRGNQRWLWGHLAPSLPPAPHSKRRQNTKMQKIWKVLSKCTSKKVHQVLFLCTNSCFPSISLNLELVASHSSLGEMTSLIERPTTSCSTSTTSTEIQATSTSTSATSTDIMLDINRDRGDINGDICADTIELSQASWHCTSHIKCWWVGSSKGLTETDFCWWQLFSSFSQAFLKLLFKLFSSFSSALL